MIARPPHYEALMLVRGVLSDAELARELRLDAGELSALVDDPSSAPIAVRAHVAALLRAFVHRTPNPARSRRIADSEFAATIGVAQQRARDRALAAARERLREAGKHTSTEAIELTYVALLAEELGADALERLTSAERLGAITSGRH